MMRGIIVCFFSIIATFSVAQQSQMYTQFMYNKIAVNPAFAGNDAYLNATLIYRDQWNGFPGSPKAQQLTLNLPRIAKKLGIGFAIERQTIGITEKITYEMDYAYKFILGTGTLSMGMNISGRSYVQDWTDSRLYAIQGLENDPSIPTQSQNINAINAGFGVYFNTNTFYVGASIPRMIRTDLDFDGNNFFSNEVRHLFLMSGGTFILNNDWRLTPQLLFRAAENSPYSLDFNGSTTYKNKYTVGLTYRTGGSKGDLGESLDVILGMQISEQLMLGFAYDISLAKIRTVENGSLELILSYNFIQNKIKTIVVNPRYF